MATDSQIFAYMAKTHPELKDKPREQVLKYGYYLTGQKPEGILSNAKDAFLQGFGQTDAEQLGLINKGAAFVGENIAPTVGSVLGAPGGIPGMMAGAAAGRATQKALAQAGKYTIGTPAITESPASVLQDVGVQALAEGAGGLAGKGLTLAKGTKFAAKAGNAAADVAGSVMHTTSGVNLGNAIQVVKDPSILMRGKNPAVTGKAIGEYSKGLGTMTERAMEIFGESSPSEKVIEKKFIEVMDMAKQTAVGELEGQPNVGNYVLLTVREQIKDLLRKSTPEYKNVYGKMWQDRRDILTNLIEGNKPGYKKLLKEHGEAKARASFAKVLPSTYNKELHRSIPDWKRMAATGAGIAGAIKYGHVGPAVAGLAAAPLISPGLQGLSIITLYGAKKMIDAAAKANLPTSVVRPMIAHYLKGATNEQRKTIEGWMKQSKLNIDPNAAVNDPYGILDEGTNDDMGVRTL